MEQHPTKKKCPECGSTKLEPETDLETPINNLTPFSTELEEKQETHKCKNCGYIGFPIPSKKDADLSSKDYEEVRICPKCNSTKVEIEKEIAAIGGGHSNPDTWHCKECEYTGIMPTILQKDKKEVEKTKIQDGNMLALLLLTLIIFLILTVLLQ